MSDQHWLSEAQLERIKPYFPLSQSRRRVDDRSVIRRIVHVVCNALRRRDAPQFYGHTRRHTTASCVGHG